MTREMPIENGTLKSNLDAANKRIENLAEPVNPNDAVTKKYLEEYGTGKPITFDDTVTETSENGVKSKGIWDFVKRLFGNLAAVATSGSYNDLTDKPEIPEGADVLTLNGQRVFKNGTEEITTYSALLALVKTGGVVLLDTVAGTIAKEALFHPHMVDDTAIRFDATGTLGEKVYTRSFAFTPKTDGGIAVSRGDLTEVAKKSDIPTSMPWASVTNKPSVFPPETHSHAQSEVSGLETALAGKRGLDDFYTEWKFNKWRYKDGVLKWDDADNVWHFRFKYFSTTETPPIWMEMGMMVSGQKDAPPTRINVEDDVYATRDKIAFVSQLSGITAQDITDFLNYEGDGSVKVLHRGDIFKLGQIYTIDPNEGTYESNKGTYQNLYYDGDVFNSGSMLPDSSPHAWKELTPGFLRLIDLFGESNSQMVATIEAKAVKVLAYEKREGDDKEYLYDSDTKLTSYAKFLAIVQSGRVVLRATATPSSGSSPVLFRQQLMNGNVVLFDATGEISGVMRTRNIQVKRLGTDGIEVVSGGLKQVALTSDISATNETFKAAVEAVFDNADTTEY